MPDARSVPGLQLPGSVKTLPDWWPLLVVMRPANEFATWIKEESPGNRVECQTCSTTITPSAKPLNRSLSGFFLSWQALLWQAAPESLLHPLNISPRHLR